MKKRLTFSSPSEISYLQQAIIKQTDGVAKQVYSLFGSNTSLSAFRAAKFEKIVYDAIFDEQINFVEYLNQTFTYLVCLFAGNYILTKSSCSEIVINFGTQSGFDVMSSDGSVICECFSSTSVKSNDKLEKDVVRVHSEVKAREKHVFFYSQSATDDEEYILKTKKAYKDVSLNSISFEELISPYD